MQRQKHKTGIQVKYFLKINHKMIYFQTILQYTYDFTIYLKIEY